MKNVLKIQKELLRVDIWRVSKIGWRVGIFPYLNNSERHYSFYIGWIIENEVVIYWASVM